MLFDFDSVIFQYYPNMEKSRKNLFIALVASNYLLEAKDLNLSSSREDEDDGIFIAAFACLVPECHPRKIGYLNVVSLYSDVDFLRNFRVTRATFGLLLHYLRVVNFRSNVVYYGESHFMPIPEMLLITFSVFVKPGSHTIID